MSDIAIKVENLSKLYHIGRAQQRHDTLRDLLMDVIRSPFQKNSKEESNSIWALKDVSFEVRHGEVMGIVGPNGAGKSTLLKLLALITEPTGGRAVINGRVGSLLEVGAGFHPELTGRENIYLYGAILGMRRVEIERKFDEIIAFSEIEKFLDTPVKRYSSGMYVRLAFAVAAHMEPEILLVDEVLAVGDAAFQKKCLGKMGDVATTGRTVLFVSHNLIALQSLCQRAIWLQNGQKQMEGEAPQVVADYLKSNASVQTEHVWDDVEIAPGNDVVRLHRMRVRPKNGSPSDPITMQTPFTIEVEFWNLVHDTYLHANLHLLTAERIIAIGTSSLHEPVWQGRPWPEGLFRCVCHIPGNLLNMGLHRVTLLIVKDQSSVIFRHEDALSFEVLDLTKRQGAWYGKGSGVVRPMLKWTTEHIDSGPHVKQSS